MQAPFPPGGPPGPADLAPPDRAPEAGSETAGSDSRPRTAGSQPSGPERGPDRRPPDRRRPAPAGGPGRRPPCAPGRPGRGSGKRRRKPPGRCRPHRRRRRTGRKQRSRPLAAARAEARADALARVAAGVPHQADGLARSSWRPAVSLSQSGLPYATAHPREQPRIGDGRRHCGSLEAILWRQWDPASPPPREVVMAVDRLAELPFRIKEKLADGLDAIFIGPGGVPELDDMTSLHGVPLPGGRATWECLCRRLRGTQDRRRLAAVADCGRDVPRGRARARRPRQPAGSMAIRLGGVPHALRSMRVTFRQ